MDKLFPQRTSKLVAVALLGLFMCAGCTHRMRVVDEATGEPISGVWVISKWYGEFPGIVHASTVCVDVAIDGTDEDGYVSVRPFSLSFQSLITADADREIYLYKPGYEPGPLPVREETTVMRMRKFDGPNHVRLSHIGRTMNKSECEFPDRRLEYRLPMMVLLRKEADNIDIDSRNAALNRLSIEHSFDRIRMRESAAYRKFNAAVDQLQARR